jgi:F-type H+-transporting ATPase subunit delta|tara:strand:- start:586 stop:1140 length:555 start_codon:yes stop_codon:yes gene_type:complete
MSRVSARYAKALIDLSIEQNQLEKVYGDIQGFIGILKNRDFANMLKSPIVKSDKKQSIFNAVFGESIDATTKAFFEIIIKKGREPQLAGISAAFVEQYKAIKNISSVTLTTATSASDEMVAAIKSKLEKSGAISGNVELETKIDADIIGGFVLEFEDKLYDASVANQLNQLKKEFSKNDYIKNV